MFEALTGVGLVEQLLSVWEVVLYVAIIVPSLLFRRVKFCLLLSFLFAYYLAFLVYWGDFIQRAPTKVSFFAYLICGFAVVALFIVESLKEKAGKKNQVRFQD